MCTCVCLHLSSSPVPEQVCKLPTVSCLEGDPHHCPTLLLCCRGHLTYPSHCFPTYSPTFHCLHFQGCLQAACPPKEVPCLDLIYISQITSEIICHLPLIFAGLSSCVCSDYGPQVIPMPPWKHCPLVHAWPVSDIALLSSLILFFSAHCTLTGLLGFPGLTFPLYTENAQKCLLIREQKNSQLDSPVTENNFLELFPMLVIFYFTASIIEILLFYKCKSSLLLVD